MTVTYITLIKNHITLNVTAKTIKNHEQEKMNKKKKNGKVQYLLLQSFGGYLIPVFHFQINFTNVTRVTILTVIRIVSNWLIYKYAFADIGNELWNEKNMIQGFKHLFNLFKLLTSDNILLILILRKKKKQIQNYNRYVYTNTIFRYI